MISSLIQLFLILASNLYAYLNFKILILSLLAHFADAIWMDHLGSNVAVVRLHSKAHAHTLFCSEVFKYCAKDEKTPGNSVSFYWSTYTHRMYHVWMSLYMVANDQVALHFHICFILCRPTHVSQMWLVHTFRRKF